MKKIIALLAIVAMSISANAGSVRIENLTAIPFTGTLWSQANPFPAPGPFVGWTSPTVTILPGVLFFPTIDDYRIYFGGTTPLPGTSYTLWGVQFTSSVPPCTGWAGQIGSNIYYSCYPARVMMSGDGMGNTLIRITP